MSASKCYSEFDPIGDTERLSTQLETIRSLGYSEFDPIGDTESQDQRANLLSNRELQRVRSDRGY